MDAKETQFATLQEPRHGLIIPDATGLAHIVQEANPQFLVRRRDRYHPERRWADGLVMLAELGLPVMIPQAVVFQAADMLPNGVKVPDCFDPAMRPDHDFRKYEHLATAYEDAQAFISHLIAADYPQVKIVPPHKDAQSNSAACMRRIGEAMASGDEAELRGAIQHMHACMGRCHGDPHRNFGNVAALELIKTIPYNFPKPVFYLGGNVDVVAAARLERPDLTIGQVNLKGYVKALYANWLMRPLDIDPHRQRPRDISEEMIRNRAHLWNNPKGDFTLIDTSLPRDREADYLFSNTLAQIKSKLPSNYRFRTAREVAEQAGQPASHVDRARRDPAGENREIA